MDDQSLTAEALDSVSRRRLLGLIGAGAAGSALALLSADRAEAGHDSTNVLHLGEVNNTPLDGGFAGRTHVATDVNDFALSLSNENAGEVAGGIYVTCVGNGKPGIEVDVLEGGGVAVQGVAGCCENFGQGPGTGVQGISGSGTGVHGHSESGAGVVGHSSTGEGGNFSSDTGVALSANGPANVFGDRPQPMLGIDNENTSDKAGAIYAISRGGGHTIQAEIFQAVEDPDLEPGFFGVAVQGVSNSGTPEDGGFGEGPGIGVVGFSGTGPGVLGGSKSRHGVVGSSESGAGVLGGPVGTSALAGVLGGAPGDTPGVQALSAGFFGIDFGEPDGGLALEVIGKSRFSTAGSAAVPAGDNAVVVANPAVTASSHIGVTLISDPGPRQLGWIERQPGSGFTVHLTAAPPPQRPATNFTYLIVDMP